MDQTKSYVFRIVRDSSESADSGEHKIESAKIGILEGTTLKDIPTGTTIEQLKKALTVSKGANIYFVKKNEQDTPEIKDLTELVTDEMEIVVESGTQTVYTIEII
ncbi:hypothetical protein [Clostridium tetani]|uniref:hypothetical protein n=1 Tax=Clostridium tetani TaxID=1513 RepID=UPI000513A253|nr:hypothetical protein [Clostridium tetani]KGI37482.1 hypothetical protein LA33_11540 [Clostridium tetani ATCC 9441]SUY65500.1 Uncharacterised protein [Clostridium tetani]